MKEIQKYCNTPKGICKEDIQQITKYKGLINKNMDQMQIKGGGNPGKV